MCQSSNLEILNELRRDTMIEVGKYKFWMDGYFKANLDIIKDEAIPNNWDAIFIVFGKEGTGKTTIATQGAAYLYSNFNIDLTCWSPEQFEAAIEKAKPESSILWDEAITGANASAWANSVSQSVISKLTQIRKKRLKIFICFPYLNMLNKYFVSRCVASIYVYSRGFKDRGHAFYYNQEQTEYLYAVMKERYRLKPSKALSYCDKAFYFNFPNHFCLPEGEYDRRKEAARQNAKVEDSDNNKNRIIYASKELKDKGWKVADIAKLFNYSSQYIYRMIKQLNKSL